MRQKDRIFVHGGREASVREAIMATCNNASDYYSRGVDAKLEELARGTEILADLVQLLVDKGLLSEKDLEGVLPGWHAP